MSVFLRVFGVVLGCGGFDSFLRVGVFCGRCESSRLGFWWGVCWVVSKEVDT